MCKSRFSDLTIGQLNCNGIKDKLEDLDFLSLITVYDVCILLEIGGDVRIQKLTIGLAHFPKCAYQ